MAERAMNYDAMLGKHTREWNTRFGEPTGPKPRLVSEADVFEGKTFAGIPDPNKIDHYVDPYSDMRVSDEVRELYQRKG